MPLEIKIDTSKIAEMEQNIIKSATEILAGDALKFEVGKFAVDRIKYQARIGQPLNSSGSFPALKDSTVRNRRYLAKYNSTHSTFSPDLSNVTILGALLDSLTWESLGNTILRLKFVGDHPIYKGARGPFNTLPVPNAKVAEYLAEKGFKIFDSSLANNQQFVSRIKTICLRYIRRGLRIRNRLSESED